MRTVGGVLGIMAVLVLLPNVQAGTLDTVTPPNSQVITIANDDFEPFRVTISTSWSLVLGITVTSGGSIDVYVTQQAGYDDYISPTATTFSYMVAYTDETTTSYNKTITSSGLHYVIVDNAAVTVSGAQPAGPVTVSLFFGTSTGSFLLGLAILAIVVILVIVVVVLVRRKRKAAAVPPPAGAPPAWPPQTPPPSPPTP